MTFMLQNVTIIGTFSDIKYSFKRLNMTLMSILFWLLSVYYQFENSESIYTIIHECF